MHLPKKITSLTILLCAAWGAHAQDQAETAADDLVRLERFVVEGVPVESSVNPLTRELSAVMGD